MLLSSGTGFPTLHWTACSFLEKTAGAPATSYFILGECAVYTDDIHGKFIESNLYDDHNRKVYLNFSTIVINFSWCANIVIGSTSKGRKFSNKEKEFKQVSATWPSSELYCVQVTDLT